MRIHKKLSVMALAILGALLNQRLEWGLPPEVIYLPVAYIIGQGIADAGWYVYNGRPKR